jgi:hypothetical protein
MKQIISLSNLAKMNKQNEDWEEKLLERVDLADKKLKSIIISDTLKT